MENIAKKLYLAPDAVDIMIVVTSSFADGSAGAQVKYIRAIKETVTNDVLEVFCGSRETHIFLTSFGGQGMATNKRTPCYCGALMAVVIIVLTVLTLTGRLEPKWPGIVIIVLAGLMGITSITGWCCSCLGKCKEDSGSCCQPPSESD